MRHSKIMAPILMSFLTALFSNAFANPTRYPSAPGTPGKTREQVKAELEEAKRTGDVMCANESNLKEREVNPGRYPAKPSGPTKSRAQVKAELEEAKRLGNIPADGETGMTMREKYPNRYPAK
ncbi:MAG: hypothetical protein RLZ63_2145 [Pseudomonadota bacterium]